MNLSKLFLLGIFGRWWPRWNQERQKGAATALPSNITGAGAANHFAGGELVRIDGTGLIDPTTFSLTGGFVSATFSMLDPGAWASNLRWDDVQFPFLSTGSYELQGTNANGVGSSLTVTSDGAGGTHAAPTVDALDPYHGGGTGSTAGGELCRIDGTNLTADMRITVDPAGTAQVVPMEEFSSDSAILFITPAHAAGPVFIKVQNADGSATTIVAFVYS